MAKKLPILIIIPHGGYRVPEELSGYEAVEAFDLFIQADTCANNLFEYTDRAAAVVRADISRLFIDLDRPYTALPPDRDGVIKKRGIFGKDVFQEGAFPDEFAIANMLKRYYVPFHDTLKKVISSREISFILECHTMMPVGPQGSIDRGKPRPLIRLEYLIDTPKGLKKTCPEPLVQGLASILDRALSGEEEPVAGRVSVSIDTPSGYILPTYGTSSIPMVRLSISKTLFLNDTYFSHDYLKVDELRLSDLSGRLWRAIERFYRRMFG